MWACASLAVASCATLPCTLCRIHGPGGGFGSYRWKMVPARVVEHRFIEGGRCPRVMAAFRRPCAPESAAPCLVFSRLWRFFPLVSQLSIVPRLRLHRLALADALGPCVVYHTRRHLIL
ncbi:hypothetical protein BC826DRAFT_448838 [Russula brevipes]|nr:hypothetical protein BC826DRAFT_448838 [Russula brevipes]